MLKGSNLTYTSDIMKSKVLSQREDIVSYNTDTMPNTDSFIGDSRANVPFPCDCINDDFLGHTFFYQHQQQDTYASIAEFTFSNLTTKERIERDNVYAENSIPKFVKVNVTVNCSCGNRKVSKDYGLFITYPLRSGDTLESIAKDNELDAELLQRYNPGVDFSQGHDVNGVYVPLPPRYADHLARSLVTAGISTGGICMVLLSSVCIYVRYFRKKNVEKSKLTPEDSMAPSTKDADKDSKFIVVDKSPEFSYEELANATDNFSLANKIGQGGFGEVYYGQLKGKVRLIGYCIEGSLFLVYEYMDNGNLSQHLHNSEKEPMTWSTRNAYGHISRKIDVYAFGVVLYELISAKAAVVKIDKPSTEFKSLEIKTDESIDEYKSLVALMKMEFMFHFPLADKDSKFIVVDKSPEFSYEELANATDNFSLANKIGQGGFGEVYYGELNGKVHLIGYCIEGFLFLVYEYMDNGNLSQHLHNSEKEPMTWSTRLQIALDVARGLENAYGHISRKIDVYAFGVVLYELISAKAAVVKIDKRSTEFKSLEIKTNDSIDEYKSLVALVIGC
ncbi:hypothetical protein TSUD_250110 [Trifolium subterraneum]|nr:hypothetical protein TSUD_250110 [Trifolium subterraneum]